MRIDKLHLRGFRCFEETSFAFRKQFNLIVGDNGAGKTSLLEALAVASAAWLLGIRGFDKRNLTPADIRLIPHDNGGEIRFEEAEVTEVSATGTVEGKQLEWARSLSGRQGRTTRLEARPLSEIAEETAVAVRAGQHTILPLLSFYGTGRLWQIPRDIRRELDTTKEQLSRFEGYRNSVDPRCSPVDLIRWLKRQEWVAFQEKREAPLLSAVKTAILRCLEGGQQVWFSAKREQVLVDFAGQGVQPFENLSDGQRNMVAMVGDIAIKAAQLNPHLGAMAPQETPGIVLIDELDLHLHPKWQRRVSVDLRKAFPKIQFFCTTHSPQIIGEVPREEVLVLHPYGGEAAPVAFGADSNWILEHVMDAAERNQDVASLIRFIEAAIDQGELGNAEKSLEELRTRIGTEEGEVVRLQSTIRNLEKLAHADD